MNVLEFSRLIAAKRKELDAAMRRKLPIKVGAMAKGFYQDSFHNQGFTNGGLKPWKKTRRQLSGGTSASSNYGALLSGRNHLYSSVKYIPSNYRVVVRNDLKYAPVHNWGGTLRPTVTPKMRKFAWAQFFRQAGIKPGDTPEARKQKTAAAGESAQAWKRLALTRKRKLKVNIPQRQFLGQSRELDAMVRQTMDTEISNILNS
jgi:phage gpG-like protein